MAEQIRGFKPPHGAERLKFRRIEEAPNIYELEDGSRIYVIHFAHQIRKYPSGGDGAAISYAMEVSTEVKHIEHSESVDEE